MIRSTVSGLLRIRRPISGMSTPSSTHAKDPLFDRSQVLHRILQIVFRIETNPILPTSGTCRTRHCPSLPGQVQPAPDGGRGRPTSDRRPT